MSDELQRILSIEESALNRNTEIDRILKCPDSDYFAVMEINPLAISIEELVSLVKKIYRKKSLLIHPDKTDHPEASKAFDKLKKAEQVLSATGEEDDKYKEKHRLYSIYKAAAQSTTTSDMSQNFDFYDETNVKVRQKVDEILLDELNQLDLQKLAKQTEEMRKHDFQKQLNKERELKRQMEAKWEQDRDYRVNNWRKYSNKIEKKQKQKQKQKQKKKKPEVLV
ncbi:spf31 [Candida oxycetoniae]|uniref:Spf31 n=1 Tax=Candida oxycetoniae TaxID=497107 RepID=A0AAI9SY10_9ASCO|nr:spf31 [Candida oxycetoniae]KAI3404815.2 spf31 [Candida oxycetoniae]